MHAVLEQLLDELLAAVGREVAAAGLDPLPIPDLTLPFGMDNLHHIIPEVQLTQEKFGHLY